MSHEATIDAERERLRRAWFDCGLPAEHFDSMANYILHGVPQGDFFSAVIGDSLMSAAAYADSTNKPLLHLYAQFLFNRAPSGCFGSNERREQWIDLGGLFGVLQQHAESKA